MTFTFGNQLWKARATHGRKRIMADAAALQAACIEYFEWVQNNPLYECKLVKEGEVYVEKQSPKMRAMTIGALTIFLDIHEDTWRDWKGVSDFSAVVAWAEKIIRAQKFEGASADMLNPNIIARDLGLKEHTDNAHHGSLAIAAMTDDQLAARYKELQEKMTAGMPAAAPKPEP